MSLDLRLGIEAVIQTQKFACITLVTLHYITFKSMTGNIHRLSSSNFAKILVSKAPTGLMGRGNIDEKTLFNTSGRQI